MDTGSSLRDFRVNAGAGVREVPALRPHSVIPCEAQRRQGIQAFD